MRSRMADLNFKLEEAEERRLANVRISPADLESIQIISKQSNKNKYLNEISKCKRSQSETFLPKLDSIETTSDHMRRRSHAARWVKAAGL
jgi:hypothetical protein